jgi:hypothetical protein
MGFWVRGIERNGLLIGTDRSSIFWNARDVNLEW